MDFAYRIFVLKIPTPLQQQRTLFDFILVSNDISRIGSRDMKDFCFYVGDEFATLDLRRRYLRGILVLYLIIFALRRDAPAVKTGDLAVRIQEHDRVAVLASAGTQDL